MADRNVKDVNKYLDKELKKKNRRKRIGIIAFLVLFATILTSIIVTSSKKKKTDNKKGLEIPSVTTENLDETKENDLETDLDFPTTQNNYGEIETTSDVIIDPNKLVTSEDEIYINQEAKDKSENIGKTVTDNKLNEGYEIEVDDSVITGEGSIPEGYIEVSKGEYIKEKDFNNIVILDSDIWAFNDNGPYVIYSKGEYVTKDIYNKILIAIENKILFTSVPNKNDNIIAVITEIVTEEETNTNFGIVNKDGTYTIYGETYRNYETFLAITDDVDLISVNGVWWLVSDYEELLNNQNAFQLVKTK